MEYVDLEHPPRFLTHHVPLQPDRLARLTLPVDLTPQEVEHLARFMGALISNAETVEWPISIKRFREQNDGNFDDLLDDQDEIDALTLEAAEEEDQIDQLQKDMEDYDRQ